MASTPTESVLQSITITAAADLGAHEFVGQATKKHVAAEGDAILGITLHPIKKGARGAVAVTGIAQLKMSGAAAQYAAVMSTAAGKGKTATSGEKGGGIVLAASAADGDIVPCLIRDQTIP